jgi:hypothetical protein
MHHAAQQFPGCRRCPQSLVRPAFYGLLRWLSMLHRHSLEREQRILSKTANPIWYYHLTKLGMLK